MDYAFVKTIHQTAVALTLAGFFARGIGSLRGAAWVRGRVAKTLPHAIDTVLLISGFTLAWMLRLNPGRAPWLMAKLVGLIVYIALGSVALRPGRPLAVRAMAWLAALAAIGWIISVAITKSPLGVLTAW